MAGWVVNSNAEAVTVSIVNRDGSLIERTIIEANSSRKLRPGEYYLCTYENSIDSPSTTTGKFFAMVQTIF